MTAYEASIVAMIHRSWLVDFSAIVVWRVAAVAAISDRSRSVRASITAWSSRNPEFVSVRRCSNSALSPLNSPLSPLKWLRWLLESVDVRLAAMAEVFDVGSW